MDLVRLTAEGPHRLARQRVRLAALLSTLACSLASCERGAEPVASAAPAPSTGAGTPATASQSPAPVETPQTGDRPAPPAHVFKDRTIELGGWYDELKKRFSPGYDGWPTEVVAAVAEQAIRTGLALAITGDRKSFEPSTGRNFAGTRLVPEELATVFEVGALTVSRGALDPASHPEGELPDLVAELVAPFTSARDPDVRVAVTGVTQLPEARQFETHASIRISGGVGEGAVQVNTEWKLGWRVPQSGKRVFLTSIEALRYERVQFSARPFVELTRHVLGGTEFGRQGLFLGSLELERRFDRLVRFAPLYLGMHGIAVGDVDGDGREDLYVGRNGGAPNQLFLHQADGTVKEGAAAAGVDFLDETAGVLVLDIDGDGHREVLMGHGPNVVIAWNDGEGRFPSDTVLACPGGEQVYSISAADPDEDGDLDLYATRYVQGGVIGGVPTPYHDANNGASNHFWRNEGEREFTDATAEVGLDHNNRRFSLASVWEDFDGDGDLDLYVTNDFGRNNLYRNEGGRFADVADQVGAFDMAAGMGISCADVDLDGDVDMYVSNMFTPAGMRVTAQPQFMLSRGITVRAGYERHTRGNSLLLGRGDGTFEDSTMRAGCGPGGWAWGSMLTDWDNDGLADAFVPNGFLTGRLASDLESFFWRCVVKASPDEPPATDEYKQAWVGISHMSQVEGLSWNGRERDFAYWNVGGGSFADASAASGLDYEDDGRVAVVVDWDGDGRLDLWIKNRTAPVLRFVRDVHTAGGWIAFELEGEGGNREAVGALVSVAAGPLEQARRVYAGEGYLGSSTRRLHFGLGAAERVDRVVVRWPDGSESEHADLAANALYRISKADGTITRRELPARSPLEGAVPERIPPSAGVRTSRVALLDRLPFSALDLPRFDGAEASVASFAGSPLLLVVWASWDDAALASLEGLARERDQLAAAGVRIYPLTLDGVRDEPYAKEALARAGFPGEGGRAGNVLKQLLEIVTYESLGPYDDLPLPVGLFFDGHGALSVLYVGAIDPEEVARDAPRIEAGQDLPGARWPTALTGGHWRSGRGPGRDLANMAKYFHRSGLEALAAELDRAIERRTKE